MGMFSLCKYMGYRDGGYLSVTNILPNVQVPVGKHVGGVLKTTVNAIKYLDLFISPRLVTVYDVSLVDCTVTCFD